MGRPKGSKNKLQPNQTEVSVEKLVHPIIEVKGDKNPLVELEEQGELPVLKSIGYCRLKPEDRYFVSYVITSQGNKILNIEVSEPDLRAIAEDSAKTAFVSNFMNDDGAI